ncbi:helix-turn-helix domain-containing protein [Lachnospiraceae bacterium OttesenSCG-928-D06]|nr:helix-turn-helix domain-containing protein [Lachnospiraceae bacterium OttesenSCG-928-D06]
MTKQFKLKQHAYASDLKSRALSVLIYLIDRSNKDLTCFPAISTMARELHISVSTVKRALKELVESGFVSKESRFREKNNGQSSNLYTLQYPEDNLNDDEKNNFKSFSKKDSCNIDKSEYCNIKKITFETIAYEDVAVNKNLIKQEYQKVCKCKPTEWVVISDTPVLDGGGGHFAPPLNLSG